METVLEISNLYKSYGDFGLQNVNISLEFAVVPFHIVPGGLLLAAVFLPTEFFIFCFFDAQKADIIGAFAIFPYMGLMSVLWRYLADDLFWFIVPVLAVMMNAVCFILCRKLYGKNQV